MRPPPHPRQHRALLLRSALRIAITLALLMAIYVSVPVAGFSGVRAVVIVGGGVLLFAAILAWQLRSVIRAEHPVLRAAEALAVAFVLLVLGFAFAYLSLAHDNGSSFSEPLDHIGAVYFAMTVISTVGFGDIAARTNAARIAVMVQIVLDFLLIAGVVRLFVETARGARRTVTVDDPPA